ncbi:centrosomal protein of 135 kDa-like isoform 1-T1 [Syngnathus typhle]
MDNYEVEIVSTGLWFRIRTMDSSIDKTRSHLRKRLDQLGYRHHFGIDSVPLVAKLFSDLVHTTVSLRDAKLSAGKPERYYHTHVSSEPPYRTVLARQLDSGDHRTGDKNIRIYLVDQSTQTVDVRLPHLGGDEDLSGRLVEPQEEVFTLKSELDFSHGHIEDITRQLAEAQEANRTLEKKLEELRQTQSTEAAELASRNEEAHRELARKDGTVAQMVAVKERVLNMAYRKLSASKDVILSQQEVIQDLEGNLSKIKAEVCEQSRLWEQLAEARGRNEQLEGLLTFLEAEKSALQEKVDRIMANDRDLVLGLGRAEPTRGLAVVIKSLEEERDRYRREAHRYKSLLRVTAPAAATAYSPTQARGNKVVLAANFQGDCK